MENELMNIDSRLLQPTSLDKSEVGDTVHMKGEMVTDFGISLEVIKVTKKQIVAKVSSLWFPVFEKSAFGRIAKGERTDTLEHLKEHERILRGTEYKFWKTGTRVGHPEKGVVAVQALNEEWLKHFE